MARVSSGVAALMCGLMVAVACSGRLQRSGVTDGSAGTGAKADSNPGGGGVVASQSTGGGLSTGGTPDVAGQDSGAGQRHGTGGLGEGGGGPDVMQPEGPSFWWSCPREAWGDGLCDCGCAILDIDCQDGGLAECELCNGPGSCSGAPCPGRIKADENRFCEPLPGAWSCPELSYADESTCDCGCGAPDPDCENTTAASCESCRLPGSCAQNRTDTCSSAIAPADNSSCYVPASWICHGDYGNGVCDCGCGATDVDCASGSVAECEDCSRGCSGLACPGEIVPTDNGVCTPPPSGWRCTEHAYLDGSTCDCGCGVVDPDCESAAVESCDWCRDEGTCSVQVCPGAIAPTNNATCYQPAPPAGWTCPASAYADGTQCDCGCGGYDLDCPNQSPSACDECWACGPCPSGISPTNNNSCL